MGISNMRPSIAEKISKYLLENQIDRSKEGAYTPASKKFGVDIETIRRVWRSLRRRGLVEKGETKLFIQKHSAPSYEQESTFKKNGNEATISKSTSKEIKNEKDLAKECNIDLEKWSIKEWECKRYNAWIKNKAGEIESQPKYSIWAKMILKTADNNLEIQKNLIIKELFSKSPKTEQFKIDKTFDKNHLYEISIPDLHCGKLSWAEESGENYDLKIASKAYRKAIDGLLSSVDIKCIKKILLPVGNDMVQVDSRRGETTAGTRVDSDSRYFKIVRTVKELIIENTLYLSAIAPVDIVIVSGNHDYETMWSIGEMLEAYFHNNPNVNVDNSASPRKYYKFGTNGFLYSHGNEEKHQELGLIFATEQPKLWQQCTTRVAKLGHFHKQKKISYVSVDEFQGFQVMILPSLSKSDFWHKSKGYMSKQAAKGFLYHERDGLVAEITYNA